MNELRQLCIEMFEKYGVKLIVFTGLVSIAGILLAPSDENSIIDFFILWFFMILASVILFLIVPVIGTLNDLSKKRNQFQQKNEFENTYSKIVNNRVDLDPILELNKLMGKIGTDKDQIPTGYGEFGLEPTNPIPVNGVAGEFEYLNKLRTIKGGDIEYFREGSTNSDNINGLIDMYTISSEDIGQVKLFLSPYNTKNSVLCPTGFILI